MRNSKRPPRQVMNLEQAGYLEIRKQFEGKMPRTTYRLTPQGKVELERYWQALELLRGAGTPPESSASS